MKKIIKYIIFSVFFVVFAVFCCVKNQKEISFATDEKIIRINQIDSEINYELYSKNRINNIRKSIEQKITIYNKLKLMGFSDEQCFEYLFPNIFQYVNELAASIEKEAKNANIEVLKNTCSVKINQDKNGIKLNKNALYCNILYNLINKNEENIKINTLKIEADIKSDNLKGKAVKRGEFKTYFGNSKEERKNNIKVAMRAIDGIVIKPGQIFSFNDCTGERNDKNGYKSANTILNGKYVESIGGGVCQVSTTLYNAALRSGLDIVEVNAHSLPVGYVDPCFDAMVNMGTSDLRIRNNTESNIYLTCSDFNDWCKVVIYGEDFPYIIDTRSVIIEEIKPGIEYTESLDGYNVNEDAITNNTTIVKPKKGVKAEGYIDTYNKEGILTVTRSDRKITYKAINQVVYYKPISV